MNIKISNVAVAALFFSSVNIIANESYWANGVNINSGWTAYLQHPNQCWGAVAGNALGWWQKNLQTTINFNKNTPQGNVQITDWFYKQYPHIQGGLQPYRGMIYFLQDFASNVKIYEDNSNKTYLEREYGPTKISGGPFWTERHDSNANRITQSLIENFKTGKVVAALTDDTHTVTLWGIEVDETTGKIKKGYISDSVVDKNGQLTIREVTGFYAKDHKGNDVFNFLYNYYVPSTNTYVTDLYDIYSITYISIDEARNNGTYVDKSNRKDCELSVLPGYEGVCKSSKDSKPNNENQNENLGNQGSSNENATPSNNENHKDENSNPTPTKKVIELPKDKDKTKIILNNSQNSQNENTTKAVKKAVSIHSELGVKVQEFGDVVTYTIQKNGKDIAFYSPQISKPQVINKGLVDYSVKVNNSGEIEITKTPNQGAIKEANDMVSLNMDINYVEINNLNKRMGELRGINANAGAWGRILGGKGSSSGYENKFTHIQVGLDKQSELSNAQIFTGFTLTHTANDIKTNGGNTSGDVKSTGGGIYASTIFDSGFYIDAIAKYVINNHKFDYYFKNMNLSFPSSKYNTRSIYLGGELGYRFDLGTAYIEPQAEFIYLKNSGANLQNEGYKLEIKKSDALIGRVGFNAGKELNIGSIQAYAVGGISYQWDMAKHSEIVVDSESVKYNKKDSRMLMNLGLNIKASENLRIGLDLERSAFGEYDTDLAINANIRYSF